MLPGCHLILPFPTCSSARYQCEAQVWEVPLLQQNLPILPDKNGSHAGVKEWVKLVEEPGIYTGGAYHVREVKDAEVKDTEKAKILPLKQKDALLLRLHREDRTESQEVTETSYFARIKKDSRIERLWVAFDSRAKTPPSWLANINKYTKTKSQLLTTLKPDGQPLPFNLYELKEIDDVRTKDLSLGGNNASGVDWYPLVCGEQYLVLVRLKPVLDPSVPPIPLPEGLITAEACSYSKPTTIKPGEVITAMDKSLKEWAENNIHPEHTLSYYDDRLYWELTSKGCTQLDDSGTASCTGDLKTTGTDFEGYVNSWVHHCKASIDGTTASLSITVRNGDRTFKSSGSGPLEGEIEFTTDTGSDAAIGELTLFGHSITLSDNTVVEKISLGQNSTIVAECADDPLPGPFRLCKRYLVPVKTELQEPGFNAGAYCEYKGVDVPLIMHNTDPMPFSVDFPTKTYELTGGPVEGEFATSDGQRFIVQIEINISGTFLELAPVVSVKDSELTPECGDGGVAEVHLNASNSYDELSGPAGPALKAYQWVENPGAPTQKLLGTAVSITPVMLFGKHNLRLYVQDNSDIWNSLDFTVDVVDPKIDWIIKPQDQWVLLPPGDTQVQVDIGEADAGDVCSGQVLITNDAEGRGWYPEGLSVVTWRFDDYHGNVVEHKQKILVLEPAFHPSPAASVLTTQAELLPGQLQKIIIGTQPKGKAMIADQYVVVYTPDGEPVSVDESGHFVYGSTVPQASDLVVGVEPTSATVFEGVFSEHFSEAGEYTVEMSLVKPGADPQEATAVLARDWATFIYHDEP